MQRLEAGDRRRRLEGEEEARGRMDEERERSVREFERTMMGLEGDHQHRRNGRVTTTASTEKKEKEKEKEKGGVKRKFELDEADIQDNVKAERAKARKAIDLENVPSPPSSLPFPSNFPPSH